MKNFFFPNHMLLHRIFSSYSSLFQYYIKPTSTLVRELYSSLLRVLKLPFALNLDKSRFRQNRCDEETNWSRNKCQAGQRNNQHKRKEFLNQNFLSFPSFLTQNKDTIIFRITFIFDQVQHTQHLTKSADRIRKYISKSGESKRTRRVVESSRERGLREEERKK